MSTTYKVTVSSTYVTNSWDFSLYYKMDNLPVLNSWFGADELAERVRAKIVPALQAITNPGNMVQSIVVQPMDDPVFNFVTLQPYKLGVGLSGWYHAGQWLPIDQVLLFRFNLAPAVGWSLNEQPRKGMISISALSEDMFDLGLLRESFADELIPGSLRNRLRNFARAISEPLGDSILPGWADGGGFKPLRVRQRKIAGIWKIRSYAMVEDARYDTRVRYNRARAKN